MPTRATAAFAHLQNNVEALVDQQQQQQQQRRMPVNLGDEQRAQEIMPPVVSTPFLQQPTPFLLCVHKHYCRLRTLPH